LAAEGFTAVEVPARLGTPFVEGAELRRDIQRDAGAVGALIHAPRAVVFDHEFLRHAIAGFQLDDPMTAAAAAGTGGKIRMGVDRSRRGQRWRRIATFR